MWTKIKTWIKKLVPQKTEFDQFRLIYRTSESHLIQLYETKLKAEGIQSFVINKKDSSYNNFGDIELYVKAEDVIYAKHIIEKTHE